MMPDTTLSHATCDTSTFAVTADGVFRGFSIDDASLAVWVDAEGDKLARHLPALRDVFPGSTLSELVYRALSANVLVGDPGIELNIRGDAYGAGYFVQLSNRVGGQLVATLTRGRHELRWSPIDLTPTESVRYYLKQVCGVANALLKDLMPQCKYVLGA